MTLEKQMPREHLDKGLALLQQLGYVQFSRGKPYLTGEFHDKYLENIAQIDHVRTILQELMLQKRKLIV